MTVYYYTRFRKTDKTHLVRKSKVPHQYSGEVYVWETGICGAYRCLVRKSRFDTFQNRTKKITKRTLWEF